MYSAGLGGPVHERINGGGVRELRESLSIALPDSNDPDYRRVVEWLSKNGYLQLVIPQEDPDKTYALTTDIEIPNIKNPIARHIISEVEGLVSPMTVLPQP